MKKSKKIVLIVISCIVVLATIAGVIFGIVMNQPASVVTKFEEKRAKEIASFKKEKPGYIVDADNRAGYVQVIFMIYPGSSMTPEKFAKKYDLKTLFPKAEIKVSEYNIVTLNFKRNNYTRATHLILTKISEKATSVYPIYPHVYAGSSIKYKPDISLHAENPTKLEYAVKVAQNFGTSDMPNSNGSNITDVNRILTTKAEYDAYIDLFAAEYDFEGYPPHLEAAKDKYDEEFFETNALLVTKEITRSNLGYGLSVDNVYLSDNKIYAVIRTSNSEGMAAMAVLEKTFYITVSKDAIKGATELITLD
ncbi:MAG: hypothetical protein E7648_02565 [Ruminococcaceae bacterium]|nr:hypothetical protein [Oscillospiraceae bacterium]